MVNHNTFYKAVVKSFADRLIALFALVILLPLFVLVAVLIKLDSNGPVFFRQNRLGRNGTIFRIYKFRSMKLHTLGKTGTKLFENDPRITRVGKYIRKTSIDELPQLLNVIKGEMSFIGPRPPVTYFPKEYKDYTEFEKQRFLVKPGISGLAQTRCREIHDWDINIPIDVEYVINYSFTLDMKLFLSSILSFFRTDNIYREQN
ncbi:MAG: sugar transferase [Bacteroidales bacterium]|nr:sugar transferase [Bacteroidales bacterium]